MLKAIQVFRIHLLELEKVSQLCQDFCQRYICMCFVLINLKSNVMIFHLFYYYPNSLFTFENAFG